MNDDANKDRVSPEALNSDRPALTPGNAPSMGDSPSTAPYNSNANMAGVDSNESQSLNHNNSLPISNRTEIERATDPNDANEPVYRPNPLPLPNQSRFIPSENVAPTERPTEVVYSVKKQHNSTLRRRNSNRPMPRPSNNLLAPTDPERYDCWRIYVNVLTFCCFTSCLKASMPDPRVQYAWREKMALCSICLFLCGLLGFITFGLTRSICIENSTIFYYADVQNYPSTQIYQHAFMIYGTLYDLKKYLPEHNKNPRIGALSQTIDRSNGVSISNLFRPKDFGSCANLGIDVNKLTCTTPEFPTVGCVHNSVNLDSIDSYELGPITYKWADVTGNLAVYQTDVLDMTLFLQRGNSMYPPDIVEIVKEQLGNDLSFPLAGNATLREWGRCLASTYKVGQLEDRSVGCFISDVILWVSLIVILSVVLIRFVFAMLFSWFISRKLGKLQKNMKQRQPMRRSVLADGIVPFPMFHQGTYNGGSRLNIAATVKDEIQNATPRKMVQRDQKRYSLDFMRFGNKDTVEKSQSEYGKELRTIMLVTCYSEGEEGLRKTFDSLAETKYNEDFKLLFIVADGIITGSGNPKSTPELIIDMLEMDSSWPYPPPALSYFSLADGSREHNKARVYAAWYNFNGRSVPTILIVKCGTQLEKHSAKPGNRGKRDSQMILMRFLQKANFNERMCPLEFELFQKIHYLMGVTADAFEIILMVDADTQVASDSLARMVACMSEDDKIMGLCGETRIENKSESWVTRIQVFEYFLSHHLQKAFESMFGSVTCLPGCFCMYRIKARKGDGYWVPIIVNPDVISTYSERIVESLHKKNLLLLGEDRFLTTLMLKTFPQRKLIFVPRAFCRTTVPNKFSILLSQRRRWINSTIHNLMELVLVRELCGIFCFSMQFVIILELIGTVTLPAAIVFTLLLITFSIVGEPQIIPLILLGAILGLPAFLILFSTSRPIYVYWMFLYLLALPIWNFVLPVYAFWHFDDFSWGATRQVHGEIKGGDGHESGKPDVLGSEVIPLRKWADWEKDRRRIIKQSSEKAAASLNTKNKSASDCDIQDLLHSIIDLNRKTTAQMSNQTNALIKLSTLQQELNSSVLMITSLQKEAEERMNELRPLTFEAQFLNDHLNSNLRIDTRVSVLKLEEMASYLKQFINFSTLSPQKEFDILPDFGSDHELELAKIATKYKSHDTSALKFELYTNVYNSELQRLEITSSRLESIRGDISIYQARIKEAERIKSIYSKWLMELNREIQGFTDRIFSLRQLRNEWKDSQNIGTDISDDDGYYTPDEDFE